MKSILALKVDEFSDDIYTLIGVHTTVEDYRIAFLLNKFLQINLRKAHQGLTICQNGIEGDHSVFLHHDDKFNNDLYLISNSCSVRYKFMGFFEESDANTYLVPEKNKIDYFIKIYGEYDVDFLNKINSIPQVIKAYVIDSQILKSKNNLIF